MMLAEFLHNSFEAAFATDCAAVAR